MNIHSVYCHHEPTSLTGALKDTAISILMSQGHEIVESDLYGSGFSAKAEKYDMITLSGDHFNYMLEQRYAAQHDMAFSPDIVGEIKKVQDADIILIHTPMWWLSVPALLKGWFDRVLVMGVSWDGGKIYENGLFKGKKVMLCIVAGGPKEYFSQEGKHKATIDQILHPINHGTLAFCGMDVMEPYVVFNSLGLDEKGREAVLKDYQFHIENLVESPTYLSRYD